MKCPVCNSELEAKETVCSVCNFDDIRHEFINDEELRMWQNYVVRPCKYAYRLNSTLQNEVTALRGEVKKLTSGGHSTSSGGSTRAVSSAHPKTTMIEGWNYNDPIAHPNSAVGKYYRKKYSISDIEARMTSNSTATVTFLAKKTDDDEGPYSTSMFSIRYRVKDKNGVILLNETKGISGLQVGDVSKESIKLTGVKSGEYVIDFVSYN